MQSKIMSRLKKDTFWSLIKNKDTIEKILEKYSGEEILPYFSVDYLLKLNYYKGCKIILDGIRNEEDDNELTVLNGEFIHNISLETEQQLYPDLLLYNKSNGKYIICELKRSKEAERQAVTELLGYELEIKNHLPLASNSEVLMILISFNYSALLQHSIESLILDNKPIMCLTPIIKDNEFEYFDIFFPECWTNTNYALLNEKAFQGITYSISNKLNREEEENTENLIHISLTAVEYVRGNCEKYKQHGFSMIWVSNNPSQVCVFITIFLMNPYYIFCNSSNRTKKSPVVENINKYMNDYQLDAVNYGSAEFAFSDAYQYLKNDVDVMEECNVDLYSFRRDMIYKGNAIKCDCWGEFGEAIRFAFLNKNVKAITNPRYVNFNEPILFFKLFDLITENYLFASGFDKLYDYFKFGVKIGCLSNLCLNYSDLNMNDMGLPVDENNAVIEQLISPVFELKNKILWDLYKLENSLQEIQMRYNLDGGIKKFDASNKKSFVELSRYLLNFMKNFRDCMNERCKIIMDMGYKNGAFFDDWFWSLIEINEKAFFESEIINYVYPVFCEFLWELIRTEDISIKSDLFQVLSDLSGVFDRTAAEGENGAQQLCKDFAAIDSKKYNNVMSELEDGLKIKLTKKYFKCVLRQYKSFDLPQDYVSSLDLIGKFDVEFLIQCIENEEESRRSGMFIEIKDNNSPAIARAAEGTVLAKTIALTPKGKIAIHRVCGEIETINFVDLRELSDLA